MRKVLIDVKFLDAAGLFERLKQVQRIAAKIGREQSNNAAAFSDAVVYLTGPHGEPLTRLIVAEETLTDGSKVVNAHLLDERQL